MNDISKEITDNNAPDGKKPSVAYSLFEWISLAAVYFSAAMLVLIIFFTHSPVNGTSMYPTLNDGDIVIINKFAYTPKSGDIVVCQSKTYGYEKPLVKRIIATEGQEVSIDCDARQITVDGKVIDEYYIEDASTPFDSSNYLADTFTVPKGKVFVMGDNRRTGASADSRLSSVGMIDEECIVGKVVLRIFPFNSVKVF